MAPPATAAVTRPARSATVRPSGLHWAVIALGGGLALLVIAALPMIGALRLVFGFSVLWILAAAFLMLLGIAQVVRYAVRLQQDYEMGVTKQSLQEGGTLLSPDDVHFDLAMKQFLLASRHQHQLSCIAVEIGEGSLHRLLQEIGWDGAGSAQEASAMGLAARVTAEATRRSDLTIKGPGQRQLVVLCPETGWAGAVLVAQKVDRALRRELGLELQVGVSTFPDDAYSLRELLDRAESELRHADSIRDSGQLVIDFAGWEAREPAEDRDTSEMSTRTT